MSSFWYIWSKHPADISLLADITFYTPWLIQDTQMSIPWQQKN